MLAELPLAEILIYCGICFYAIYSMLLHVYASGNVFVKYSGGDSALVPGWKFLDRLQDTSDGEWSAWTCFMSEAFPYYILHLLLASLLRLVYTNALPICHFMVTVLYIINYVNIRLPCLIISEVFLFYSLSLLKSRFLIWICGVLILIFNTKQDIFVNRNNEYDSFLADICLAWLVLKCISFSFYRMKRNVGINDFFDFVTYVFYLPTFFFGPFIPYEEFVSSLNKEKFNITPKKIKDFFLGLLHYGFWAGVIELASHYFYCSALHYNLNSLVFLNPWTLNGVGFCMAQFFYLKYLVIYGLMGTVAKFEGYYAPPPPLCVNRIHLYSRMWRYFDRGYYLFTVRCIYQPVCGNASCTMKRKLLASFLSFAFVLLWHGVTYTVFYWSLFNFIGITIEATGKFLCSTKLYFLLERLCITPLNFRRVSCIIIAPFWILAVISNYFFFGGYEYGFKCFQQFLDCSWKLPTTILIVAYAVCQISVEIENSDKQIFKEKNCPIQEEKVKTS